MTGWESSPRRRIKTIKNRRLSPAAVFARATSELFAKDGGEILSGGTVYSLNWGPAESLRDFVYFQLARAIEERCLEDLRTCRQCERLFVADKNNQKSCDSRCKDAFNNLRRQQPKPEWNGKPYHRFLREDRLHRKKQLKKTARLLSDYFDQTSRPTAFFPADTASCALKISSRNCSQIISSFLFPRGSAGLSAARKSSPQDLPRARQTSETSAMQWRGFFFISTTQNILPASAGDRFTF